MLTWSCIKQSCRGKQEWVHTVSAYSSRSARFPRENPLACRIASKPFSSPPLSRITRRRYLTRLLPLLPSSNRTLPVLGFPDPIRRAAGRRHRCRRDAVPVEGAREAALLICRCRVGVRRCCVDVGGQEGAEPARGVLRGRAEHRGGQAPSPLRYSFSLAQRIGL